MKRTILFDFNNIAFAMFSTSNKTYEQSDNDIRSQRDYFHYLVLNKIRFIKNIFPNSEIVIAAESSSWRKKAFKFYKAQRVLQRKDSGIDMQEFIEATKELLEDFKELFPYRVIRINGAEGDDIIAILSLHLEDHEIIIASSDKDFQQLQKHKRIKQFDPIRNRNIVCDDPYFYLESHILMGDSSDGITNILSDRDTFINPAKRQKPCGAVKVNKILNEIGLEEFFEEQEKLEGYENIRKTFEANRKLIELSFDTIPKKLCKAIIDSYESQNISKDYYITLLRYFNDKNFTYFKENVYEFL